MWGGRKIGMQKRRKAENQEARKAGRRPSAWRGTPRIPARPPPFSVSQQKQRPRRRRRAVWRSLPRHPSLHIYQNTVSRQRAACSAAEVELCRHGPQRQKRLLSCSPCGLHRTEIGKAAPRFRSGPARNQLPPRGNGLELKARPLRRPRQVPLGGGISRTSDSSQKGVLGRWRARCSRTLGPTVPMGTPPRLPASTADTCPPETPNPPRFPPPQIP